MTIGIIGCDERAVALGKLLRRCGHTISFSDARAEANAQRAAHAVEGAVARTPYQQAAQCEALLFAVVWEDLERTLAALGTYKDGIVIDATRPPQHEGPSGAERLAHMLDNRHVVKAFVEPPESGRSFRVASDDPEARAAVESLIEGCGCRAIDAGPLERSREIEKSTAA